jgi:hypothetical protein
MRESLARFSASFSRLSSAERWFIIIAIIVIFAVVNFVFIIPRFDDWSDLTNRMDKARDQRQKFEDLIAETPKLQKQITALEGENSAVPQEDQAINFLTAIQNQAAQSGVQIQVNNRSPDRTNQFFLERAQTLTTISGEAQLVDFLYNLGTGSSLIRVRALSIGRDPSQQQLKANVTLIASFQKKSPVRSKPAAPKTTSPAPSRPATTPGVPPPPGSSQPSTTKK